MISWLMAGGDPPSEDGSGGRPLAGSAHSLLRRPGQRRQSTGRLRTTWGLVVALLVVGAGAFIGAVPANAEGLSATAPSASALASWNCWANDNVDWDGRPDLDYQAGCERATNTSRRFGAVFYSYGEGLHVYDRFGNDHHTYAYLDILDTPNVDYTRHTGSSDDFDFSITEGTRISLKVCSSQTSGAKCSPTVYGRA